MFENTPDPVVSSLKAEITELQLRNKKLSKLITSQKMRPLEELLSEFKARSEIIIKKIIYEINLGVATDEDIALVKETINLLDEYTNNILSAINSQTLGTLHEMQIDSKYKLLEYEKHQLRKIVSCANFTDSIPINKRAEVLEAITSLRTIIEDCTKLDVKVFY